MHNPNLILRKHQQTESEEYSFYKINGLYALKISRSCEERKRKMGELIPIKGD